MLAKMLRSSESGTKDLVPEDSWDQFELWIPEGTLDNYILLVITMFGENKQNLHHPNNLKRYEKMNIKRTVYQYCRCN